MDDDLIRVAREGNKFDLINCYMFFNMILVYKKDSLGTNNQLIRILFSLTGQIIDIEYI